MSQAVFEQVLIGIQSLPPELLAKLREILNAPSDRERRLEVARALAHAASSRDLSAEANGEARGTEVSPPNGPPSARAASLRDFTADRQWLADHRDEYAGQWVALKFGRLISHGANAKEVHQAAQDAGHSDALLVLVEPSDAPPFIL
jgi:hypothetical protein